MPLIGTFSHYINKVSDEILTILMVAHCLKHWCGYIATLTYDSIKCVVSLIMFYVHN